MSEGLIDELIAREKALINALDKDDIEALETALAAMGEGVSALRALGSWRETPGLIGRLKHALALAEAARIRIVYLMDRNDRRLDQLGFLTGQLDQASNTYGAHGRMSARS